MIANRRLKFRDGLSPFYVRYYDALCDLLPPYWQPVSGVRTLKDQGLLYSIGRDTPGEVVTLAKPGMSFHNYGLASDWDYFPRLRYEPLKATDPLWQEYIDACEKAGLRCISWEKPHNEYPLKRHISELYLALSQGGMAAVNRLIAQEAR